MLLLPSLFLGASMKHGGGKKSAKCSAADRILMKKLSVLIKLAADPLNKRGSPKN